MTQFGRISLLLAAVAIGSISAAFGAVRSVYSTGLTVEPAAAGVYTVNAKVTDLSTKAVVSQAILKVPVDEPASSETLLADGETRVLLTVTLDSAKHTATYSIEVRRAAEVLAASSASVPLAR